MEATSTTGPMPASRMLGCPRSSLVPGFAVSRSRIATPPGRFSNKKLDTDPQADYTTSAFFEGAVGLDVDLTRKLIFVADSPRGLLILRDDTP